MDRTPGNIPTSGGDLTASRQLDSPEVIKGNGHGREVKSLESTKSNILQNIQKYVSNKIHPPKKNTLPSKEYKEFKFSKTFIGKLVSTIKSKFPKFSSSKKPNSFMSPPISLNQSTKKDLAWTSATHREGLPSFSKTPNPSPTNSPPSIGATPKPTTPSHDSRLNQEVSNEVERFLFPYLTGQITAETDNPNRGPLVDTIIVKLAEKGFPDLDTKRGQIEEIALKAYFNEAARGIGRQLGSRKPTAEEMKQPVKVMSEALGPALAIDFPNIKKSPEEIENHVKDAIKDFKKKSDEVLNEIMAETEEREELSNTKETRKERVVALLGERASKGELFLTKEEHAALDTERELYDNHQVQLTEFSAGLLLFLDPEEPEDSTQFFLQKGNEGKFHMLLVIDGKEDYSKVPVSLAQIKATEELRAQLPPGWKESKDNQKLATLGLQVFQNPSKQNFIINDLGQLQKVSKKELAELIKKRS